MNELSVNAQLLGYSLAAVVYLILGLLLLTNFRGKLRGGLFSLAVFTTAVWASLLAVSLQLQELSPIQLFFTELIHDLVWIAFLSSLFGGGAGVAQTWLIRYGGVLLTVGLLVVGVGRELYSYYDLRVVGVEKVIVLASILTALYVLVAIEQVYRNARESQRRGIKYLCLGVGGIFAFDIFLYSNAILAGSISSLFWGARGFVVVMCAPLIAIAAQRTPSWSVGIFVSRQVVFYTATVIGAGVYLTIVGVAGYYIRQGGGELSSLAQILFFASATIALGVFLFSDTTRARLRVFIVKHFYTNKYDYREEWLQLIDTLASESDGPPLKKRAIKALSDVLGSPAGVLWLRTPESDKFRCVSGWNAGPVEYVIAATDPLAVFLSDTGWIVDLREYGNDPSHYEDIRINVDKLGIASTGFIVPLVNIGSLMGFVVLEAVPSRSRLNFEDRDLLKTAAQQVASYLAQEIATERLAESRQFEGFNRLTAYLMHDIKNVIAQQSLVVENAKKHRHNPQFIDDAVETIKSSVGRMRRVMEHLQRGIQEHAHERVEVGKLIMIAASECADRVPEPRADIGQDQLWVRADRDRLMMAIYHAIRNAQDAAGADGDVSILLSHSVSTCSIKVTDNGTGMDEKFIRERLFKPFDSTKGQQGMGIGAYQLRETVHSLGGEVHVESQPGLGTSVVIQLNKVAAK